MSDRDNGGFFEGLIVGGLIGVVCGLLYAPQSGDKSRAMLRKFKDENQDVIDNAVNSSETLLKATRESIEDGFNKVSNLVEEKIKKKTK